MRLFVSHASALRHWRSLATRGELDTASASKLRDLAGATSCAEDIARLAPSGLGLSANPHEPLDVLVAAQGNRRAGQGVQPHVWTSPLPRGAFCYVAPDVYVCSPPFVYLQLAGSLDAIDAARLAMELCGTYSLDASHVHDGHEPIARLRSLRGFMEKVPHAYGAAKAAAALRWVADNSGSPRETALLLALCLPTRLGGYGLDVPVVNPRLRVGRGLAVELGSSTYLPSLWWVCDRGGVHRRVSVEYDDSVRQGTAWSRDAYRLHREALRSLGLLATKVDRPQLSQARLLEPAALQVAHDLGLRRGPSDAVVLARRDELLRRLSSDPPFGS